MEHIFRSLQHPKEYAYGFSPDAWDSKAIIDARLRMFSTYGDGLTQHSGDWSVQIDFLTDYLASLATAMIELPASDKLIQDCTYAITRSPSVDRIAFAASVIYKESDSSWAKRRYYSLDEQKISGAQSKQYDKRYHQIESWMDGEPEAIYRLLTTEHMYCLERYTTATAIRNWILTQKRGRMALPADFLGWFDHDRSKAQALRNGYEACALLVEAYRLKANAVSTLDNYQREIDRRAEEKAAKAANVTEVGAEAAAGDTLQEAGVEIAPAGSPFVGAV
jgi:hypothetical protein